MMMKKLSKTYPAVEHRGHVLPCNTITITLNDDSVSGVGYTCPASSYPNEAAKSRAHAVEQFTATVNRHLSALELLREAGFEVVE